MPQTATPAAPSSGVRAPIVNDCSIQVATVNGSGSQTANNTLLRAIFQMGIPVSGKNLFPSNISGLPTWFTIRANKHGYIARRKEIDVLVCMNSDTAVEDVKGAPVGAAVVYDETLGLDKHRTDLVFYPVPFQRLVKDVLPRAEAAQARGQHDLRGRGRAPPRDRRGRDHEGPAEGLQHEAQGLRAEQGRRRGRPGATPRKGASSNATRSGSRA